MYVLYVSCMHFIYPQLLSNLVNISICSPPSSQLSYTTDFGILSYLSMKFIIYSYYKEIKMYEGRSTFRSSDVTAP